MRQTLGLKKDRRAFGRTVCQAITDALAWEAYDADAVLNLIESQEEPCKKDGVA